MINLKTILLSTILVLAGIIVVSEINNAPRVADHENGMIEADHSDFKVVATLEIP